MSVSSEEFLKKYSAAIEDGSSALFVGAGLSRPAGLADWRTLLRSIAEELELDIDQETDLISLAQYHVNERKSRSTLNDVLVNEFVKGAKATRNHELIARLPIRTVWTTNYDTLIEDACRSANKKPDIKITQENLALSVHGRDVTIYKMHGDVSQPDSAVLTRGDYEDYELRRALFSVQLKGDLVSKTFLFVGFSFTDPNIDYVLSRIRLLMGENQRMHFCIMRRPEPATGRGRAKAQREYDARRMNLRIGDLKRYNIQAVLVDDYAEITSLFEELNRRAHSRSVFVSGSAHEFGPLGRDRIEALCRLLGQEIIRRGFDLVSGFGLGIGGAVIVGATEARYEAEEIGSRDRLMLRPFPQTRPARMSQAALFKRYRQDMIANARYVIVVSGNKKKGKGVVVAPGVLEECEIARSQGKVIIPVGATGHAARQLWTETVRDQKTLFRGLSVKRELERLGDESSSDDDLVDAVFSIIEKASSGVTKRPAKRPSRH